MIDVLSRIELFSNLKQSKVLELIGQCIIQLFNTNTVLFKEGEQTKYVWILKGGRVQLLKKAKFAFVGGTSTIDYNNIEGPSKEDLALGNYKEIDIKVEEIGPGEILGLHSLAHDTPLGFSCITTIPTEVIIISYHDVQRFVEGEMNGRFGNLMKVYPDGKELRKIYIEKVRWEMFKNKFITGQRYEINLKKLKGSKASRKKPKPLPPDCVDYIISKNRLNYLSKLSKITSSIASLSSPPPQLPALPVQPNSASFLLSKKKAKKT